MGLIKRFMNDDRLVFRIPGRKKPITVKCNKHRTSDTVVYIEADKDITIEVEETKNETRRITTT